MSVSWLCLKHGGLNSSTAYGNEVSLWDSRPGWQSPVLTSTGILPRGSREVWRILQGNVRLGWFLHFLLFFSWKEGGKFYLEYRGFMITAGRSSFPNLEGRFESSCKQQMCRLIAPCFSSVLLKRSNLDLTRTGRNAWVSVYSSTSTGSHHELKIICYALFMTWTAEPNSSGLRDSGWAVQGTTMAPRLPWIALAQSTDWKNMDCNQLKTGWTGVIRFTLPKARKSRSVWEEVEICWYCLQLNCWARCYNKFRHS